MTQVPSKRIVMAAWVVVLASGTAFAQSASDAPDHGEAQAPPPTASAEPDTGSPSGGTSTPQSGGGGASEPSTTSADNGGNPPTATAPVAQPPPQASTPPASSTSQPTTPGWQPATPPPATPPPHEDDGRSMDILFIQPEGGVSYVDLVALSSNGHLLPTLSETKATGYGGGATLGFRSWIFAVAAHGYISRFNAMTTSGPGGFDLGQVMVDVQLRLPIIPIIEPYIRVGFGYAWMGNFQLNSMYAESTSEIQGWTAKAGIGVDFWLGKIFTIGLGIDFSLINLRRDGVMRADSACPQTDPTCVELRMDGDGFGTLTHVHLQLGLHF